ncbi:ABC transporter permease [Streptomyces sp. NEAU-sy36]|uniref:FtsX-like permease family protein n=1 Tax=unclassified Streptomyces TaxID=2593676 RepID=UPI0015D5812D|nr:MULTISPECIES: ABC transporter permease [unclassified Streptomyces]QLJ03141.1 ABC transporter permease [Streptomyces sp. NEAU-sy36]
MFLALLELKAARGRFLLMGSVVVLVAALVGIVSGFTTGLGDDTVSALRRLPATHIAFAAGSGSDQFARGLIDERTVGGWRREAGVSATPLGVAITRGTTDRHVEVDLAAFGVEPGAFTDPGADDGKPLAASAPQGIVVSRQLVGDGVRIGDTLAIDRLGIRLKVVGTTGRSSYGHVPAAYVTADTWRRIRFTTPGTGARPGDLPRQYSAMALKLPAGFDGATLADADRRHHTATVPLGDAFAAAPGYEGERLTMTSIQTFLFLIAPLVVGAFFAVWTVQRTPELALLRAMGASRRRLLGHTLAQAAVVVVAGTAVGAVLAFAVGLFVGEQVPFSLPAATLATTMAAVTLVGLAGSAFTLRRVTTVDPMIMLGAAR